jgi:hypothetical protein
MKTLAQALPTIERLDAEYWAADERRDWPQIRRLGRLRNKAREVGKELPILSDADAARKLELAAYLLEPLGGPDVEIERLERLATSIGASDTALTDLYELRVCVLRLTEDGALDYDHILTDNVVPHIDAVIAWLGRSRAEHEGVTVTFAAPGGVVVTGKCAGEVVLGGLRGWPSSYLNACPTGGLQDTEGNSSPTTPASLCPTPGASRRACALSGPA